MTPSSEAGAFGQAVDQVPTQWHQSCAGCLAVTRAAQVGHIKSHRCREFRLHKTCKGACHVTSICCAFRGLTCTKAASFCMIA